MPLHDLTESERDVVHACLTCVASGTVIEHDSEFQMIMGIEPWELRAVLDTWPDVDESDEAVQLAINNSMVNLLGYPHRYHDRWETVIAVPREEVGRVFAKWRAARPAATSSP